MIGCTAGDPASWNVLVASENVLPHVGVRADRLIYRFDGDAPVEGGWVYSDRSAMLPALSTAASFMGRLPSATRLVVRMFGSDGSVAEEGFDLRGASNAVAKLSSDCGITGSF